jgi:AAHS family benzoate transporter-like MFS transporter
VKRKQLFGLFTVNGAPYLIGHAVLPIFPVYMADLGASAASIGLYLAMIFAGLFIGTLSSGWISDRWGRRKLTVLIGVAMMAVSMFAMTIATTPLALSLCMTVAWFGGGISGGMVNALAGFYADPSKRGQIFGTLGMARGAAGILGGTVASLIVKHLDYDALFYALVIGQLAILATAFVIEDKVVIQPRQSQAGRNQAAPMMAGAFLMLLVAGVMVNAVHFGSGLGRPLKMAGLDLSASSIMTTSIAAGFAALIAPFILGWLSDRIERKQLLMMCYGAIMLAAVTLAQATDLWHFWVSTLLFNVGMAGMSVGSALVTDMLPKEALATGLARYSSTPWLGAVIGFGTGGFIIKALNVETTFMLAATLPVIAMILIASVNPRSRIRITQTQPMVAVGD